MQLADVYNIDNYSLILVRCFKIKSKKSMKLSKVMFHILSMYSRNQCLHGVYQLLFFIVITKQFSTLMSS